MFSLVMALVMWSRFTCTGRRALLSAQDKSDRVGPEVSVWMLFDIYLSRCIAADELVVYLLGFGGQFWGFGFLVVLTRQVKGDVLLAELWDQEGSEQAQSIWKRQERVYIPLSSRNTWNDWDIFLSGVTWRTYFDWTTACRTTPSMSAARRQSTCRETSTSWGEAPIVTAVCFN